MNWNTYKMLNARQKEEYNFRFKDKSINVDFNMIVYCFFAWSFSALAIASLITMGYKDLAFQLRDSTFLLSGFLLKLIAGIYFVFLSYNVSLMVREHIWIKKAKENFTKKNGNTTSNN